MPIIPALWKYEADRSPEVRCSRPAWPSWRNPVSTKLTKLSQVWWHAPIIPATQEAEAGELLKHGWQRLQWAEIMPHCTPAWETEQDSISKNKQQKQKQTNKQKELSQQIPQKYKGSLVTNMNN